MRKRDHRHPDARHPAQLRGEHPARVHDDLGLDLAPLGADSSYATVLDGGPQLGEMEAGFVASIFRPPALGTTISIAGGGLATLLLVAIVTAIAPIVRNFVMETHEPVDVQL